MNNDSQASDKDPEALAQFHVAELIHTLVTQYQTTEAFTEALAQARRALLEALDTVEPAQVVEEARNNAMPDAIQVRLAKESEQRQRERGSLQDPLFPPTVPKHWD